jgi:hypothetical protein
MGVIRKERPTRGLGTDRDIFFHFVVDGQRMQFDARITVCVFKFGRLKLDKHEPANTTTADL